MKLKPPSIDLQAFRAELLQLFDKYAGKLESVDILAIGAYTVGQIIAYQNQRMMSKNEIIDLVIANIEKGNADAIAHTFKNPKGQA